MANTLPTTILPSGTSGNTTTGATTGAGGGGTGAVGAIASAVGDVFQAVNSALQPGIISARAYFEQLLQARPTFQNPFEGVNESRKNTNTILIYAGVAIILMLILAIIVKSRKSK